MSPLGIVWAGQGKSLGFSLVELMVTLSVLAILTTIAVPGMVDLYRSARLATQTDLLVSTFNSARLEAVTRRTNMTVCPMANPNTDAACSTAAGDWSNGFGVWDGTQFIQRVQAKGGVTLASALNVVAVVFRGTLGSSTAAASLTLCATGRTQQQVNVALSGYVSKASNSICP